MLASRRMPRTFPSPAGLSTAIIGERTTEPDE
jgi:hypothetical protein